MGAPGAGPRGLDDAPGHRDGTAADHHADREEGEALPQCRGVQGEGEVAAGGVGPGHDPAEQGGKTQGHLQTAPLRPRLAPLLCGASRYQSRSCSRMVISGQPNTYARVTATVVRPQAWARTMPKLHRTRTVS